MVCDYGKQFLELIKEHPEWTTKKYAEALGMEWNDRTSGKLYAYRKSHAKEIAELLGEPVNIDDPEACEKARAELLGMTDEEREEYKNQCKGYEMRKKKAEKEELENSNKQLSEYVEQLQGEINGYTDELENLKNELAKAKKEVLSYKDELTRIKVIIADAVIAKGAFL